MSKFGDLFHRCAGVTTRRKDRGAGGTQDCSIPTGVARSAAGQPYEGQSYTASITNTGPRPSPQTSHSGLRANHAQVLNYRIHRRQPRLPTYRRQFLRPGMLTARRRRSAMERTRLCLDTSCTGEHRQVDRGIEGRRSSCSYKSLKARPAMPKRSIGVLRSGNAICVPEQAVIWARPVGAQLPGTAS